MFCNVIGNSCKKQLRLQVGMQLVISSLTNSWLQNLPPDSYKLMMQDHTVQLVWICLKISSRQTESIWLMSSIPTSLKTQPHSPRGPGCRVTLNVSSSSMGMALLQVLYPPSLGA